MSLLIAIALMAAPLTAGMMTVCADEADGYDEEYDDEYYDEYEIVLDYYTDYGDFEYRVNDDQTSVTIEDFFADCNYKGVLRIPAEIEGYKVTAIGYEAFQNLPMSYDEIIVPDSVTFIDSLAFYDMDTSHRQVITIPPSVTEFGNSIVLAGNDADKVWLRDRAISRDILSWLLRCFFYERNPTGTQPEHYDLYADFDTDTYLKTQRLCTKDGREITLEELGIQEPTYDFDYLCTIRGYTGSAAELYAEWNDIKFESIGAAPANASVFSGQSLAGPRVSPYSALFAIGGLAAGILGCTAVFLPKLRKKNGKSE